MTTKPSPLTSEQLAQAATRSAALFRAERLSLSTAWATHYKGAREKFELLFRSLHDLNPQGLEGEKLADAYGLGMGEALRYLAGPPISEDDLQVIADVHF